MPREDLYLKKKNPHVTKISPTCVWEREIFYQRDEHYIRESNEKFMKCITKLQLRESITKPTADEEFLWINKRTNGEILNQHFTKETKNGHWIYGGGGHSMTLVLEEWNEAHKSESTACPLEWLTLKRLTLPSAGKGIKQPQLSSTAGPDPKLAIHFREQCDIFWPNKICLRYSPGTTSSHLKDIKIHGHTKVCLWVVGHNNHKLKATQLPIIWKKYFWRIVLLVLERWLSR